MALFIAKDSALTDIVSDESVLPDDTGYNPITTTHNINGDSVEVMLYLMNDLSTKMYQDIQLKPVDLSDDNSAILSELQIAADNVGVAGVYNSLINFNDVVDSNVGHAFWVKVTMPSSSDTFNQSKIGIEIDAKEFAV